LFVDNAEYWRARAAETRALADLTSDPNIRSTLLDIAKGYEHLAELAALRHSQRK
jgi:hypothetical protein